MGLPVHGAGEPLHGGEGDVQGQAAPPVRPHAASSTPEDAVGWAVSPAAFSAAWASRQAQIVGHALGHPLHQALLVVLVTQTLQLPPRWS